MSDVSIVMPNVVKVDLNIEGSLTGVFQDPKQLDYITMLALNRTATDVNIRSRERVKQTMVVRNERFVLPPLQLPRDWRANPKTLQAYVAYGDKTKIGQARQAMLAKFQQAGIKYFKGYQSPLFIPTRELRPDKSMSVRPQWYPSALRLTPRRTATKLLAPTSRRMVSGAQALVGKRRTFVLDPATMHGLGPQDWGIYVRTGSGKHDLQLLWAYRKQIKIPHLLNFVRDARAIVDASFETNFWAYYHNPTYAIKNW